MKILITGGCGFLGSNISKKILKDKIGDLIIIDNLSRIGANENLQWLKNSGLKNFHNINIQDYENIKKIILSEKPDVIYHLAGQVAMTTSIENPRLDFEINALGTLNVLESVRIYSPNSIIVYSSTNKVYGDFGNYRFIEKKYRYIIKEKPNGFDELESLDFHSPYGCSKGTADQYLLDYCRLYGIKTIVFRHSSMYGGRQYATFDQGWVGWFCQKAIEQMCNKNSEPFSIAGNGKQVRDLLYADDAVDLYLNCINYVKVLTGKAFNIGGGMSNSFSLLELFNFLEIEYNVKLNYFQKEVRQSDQKIFVADISKVTELTGWTPKVSKEEGVKNNIEWIKQIYR